MLPSLTSILVLHNTINTLGVHSTNQISGCRATTKTRARKSGAKSQAHARASRHSATDLTCTECRSSCSDCESAAPARNPSPRRSPARVPTRTSSDHFLFVATRLRNRLRNFGLAAVAAATGSVRSSSILFSSPGQTQKTWNRQSTANLTNFQFFFF